MLLIVKVMMEAMRSKRLFNLAVAMKGGPFPAENVRSAGWPLAQATTDGGAISG